MRHSALLATLALLACSEKEGADLCNVDALSAGDASADLDGASWSATATWNEAGSSVQIVTTEAAGWRMTLVAQTAGGTGVADAIAAGSFPVEVTFGEGEEGGFVTLYLSGESGSYTTNNGAGGSLSILAQGDDGSLDACGSFEAASTAGDAVNVENFAVRAASL